MRPHADVSGAGTRDLADLGQLFAHFDGVRHHAFGGQRRDVLGDLGAALGVMVGTAPPLCLVSGLNVPGAVGVIGACPALLVVPTIAQWVENLFVPRRCDVQRPPGAQFNASGQRMNVCGAIVVSVQNRARCVLIGIEAGKRRGFPLLDDLLDLLRGGLVLGRPRDNAGRIAPLVRAGVGDLGDQVRITAQDRDLGAFLTLVVARLEQIPHGTAGAALAMGQKLYVHGASVPSSLGS